MPLHMGFAFHLNKNILYNSSQINSSINSKDFDIKL